MSFEQEKRRGRTSFILAASFLGAVLVAGVAVGVFLTVRGNNNADPEQPAPTPTAAATTSADTTDGACGPVPYETTNTLTSAPQTTWEPWSATIIATSSEAGPEKDADGVRTCYSRTATGALLAAYNSAQYCADSVVLPKAVEAVYADTPGKSIVLEQTKTSGACQPSGPSIKGFRFASYTGDQATLYLEIETPNGTGEYGIQMVWDDGDWKVATDPAGNSPVASGSVTSSSAFTPWGPGNG